LSVDEYIMSRSGLWVMLTVHPCRPDRLLTNW
jgi:hypothetical protein